MNNILTVPEWLARVLIPLLVLAFAPCASAEVPRQIASSDPGRQQPVWVSADEAFVEGQVKTAVFSEFENQLLGGLLRSGERSYQRMSTAFQDGDGCIWLGMSPGPRPLANHPLEDLHRNAAAAVFGRVVDGREGFYYGRPGALYEIEVISTIKSSPGSTAPERIFMVYPNARIDLGRFAICQDGPRYPTKPIVGRNILVYSWEPLPEAGTPIVKPLDEEVFYELSDGSVSLPHRYGEPEGDLTLEQLVQRVQSGG